MVQQSIWRRFLTAAAAGAVVLAYVQVASVHPTTTRQTDYTWSSFFGEVRGDLEATVDGIRRERAEHTAVLTKMRYDLRNLDQRISGPDSHRFG